MESRLVRLRDQGRFRPRVIYDIGAYKGEFTQLCRRVWGGDRDNDENTRILQFEANQDLCGGESNNGDTFCVLLGNEDSKPVLYYKTESECATGNSMFRENSVWFADENIKPEPRETIRLDSFAKAHQLPLPDFLKLDTQGSELLILQGAPVCIAHARVILLEVALHAYNQSAPLIADILEYMRKTHGFVMIDIVELHYAPGTGNLFQIDVLLCREKDPDLFQRVF